MTIPQGTGTQGAAGQGGAADQGGAAGQTVTQTPGAPASTGSTGGARAGTGQGAVGGGGGGGGTLGNQTGLGNIGPETERERRAQERSDEATKKICVADCR
jgi:hypothetical protein